MLRFLRIKRLAVIDSVEVEFAPGLNVLTGETGAGKSILVEAVGLLLGGRASGDLVRTGEDAATIEAIFESGGEELLIRREITAQGRSRAFVNGALATAGVLKDLSARLIELHGQHEHQTLLDPSTHLGLSTLRRPRSVDAARGGGVRSAMRRRKTSSTRVRRAAADRRRRQDLVTFQLGELERAALKPGEDEELTAHAPGAGKRRSRRTPLQRELRGALRERRGGARGPWPGVAAGRRSRGPRFAVSAVLDAREGIKSQLEDLAVFLRRYADAIEASPARLQQIEERLALLERLKRKYGPTLADVMARRDALRRELIDLESSDERVAELEREHAAARTAYLAAAQALSSERRRVAVDFAGSSNGSLGELAMEQTRFDMRFNVATDAGVGLERARDRRAEFFVSANPGEELRQLARIASGGELSRIMLAIKTLTATSETRG